MSARERRQRALFDTLQATQWLPKQELEAYQRRQLANLVAHAARTTSFYKERLAPVLRKDGDVDLSRWQEVPILKRSEMLEHQAEILSNDVPKHHGVISEVNTSGSTGIPIQMKWTGRSRMMRTVARWRNYMWHDFDFRFPYAELSGSGQWPEGTTKGPWGPPWTTAPLGPHFTIELTTSVSRLTEWIHRKKVRYFAGNALLLRAIAEEAARQKLKLDLACMIGQSMQASILDRDAVAEHLGIPLIEIYSAVDCGQIAHQCQFGSYHVLSELVLLEILDEHDRPCPPGVQGRVIVTVLHGSAQPTIRYDLGDITAFLEPCRCGRSLPVIAPIFGRSRHMFRFIGDGLFSPADREICKILKPILQPSWYQLAQTGPRSVELRFVTKAPPPQNYQAIVRASMPDLLRRADISISFKKFDAIPTPPDKKHILFVNEYENPFVA